MKNYQAFDTYLETNLDRSIQELSVLCKQPSVSAQGIGLKECAEMVASMLEDRGFRVEVIQTKGAPIVFAERKGISEKTLLFYNHYDVQPAEPLELWHTPPFEPTLQDRRLYGRGTSDDKGQFVSRLHAIDAILASGSELPCTIKFVLEGEEETSSINLHPFVAANAEKLRADACIWEFGGVDHRDMPMQYLGLRGICYVELSAETANQDVHSGLGGSIFPNAAWRLIWALNSIKGSDEKILIPGIYDDVIPPTQRDRDLMAALPDPGPVFRDQYGIKKYLKDIPGGVELSIAQVFEPTCTVCGFTSGYQGPGSKTVLPAKASAKIDFRLVPNQKPEKVLAALKAHLLENGFSDIHVEFLGGDAPSRTDPDDPFIKLVVDTSEEVYGVPMQIVPMVGGSGPNYIFSETLHVPIATAGGGSPNDQAHAPNESIRLDLYLKTARHIVRIIEEFGEN